MVIHNFQQTVTLADGTVKNGSAFLNTITDDLWIYLDEGTDMMTALSLFSDSTKTISIRTDLTQDVHQVYEGYITLNLIRQDGGKVSCRLRKPTI